MDYRRIHVRITETQQTRRNPTKGHVIVVIIIQIPNLAATGLGEICRPLIGGKQLGTLAQKLCPRGYPLLGMFVQFLRDAVGDYLVFQ